MNLDKTKFEHLANELIHEILDYFHPIDLIRSFQQLNKRFTYLLSQRLFHIDLSNLSKPQYDNILQNFPLHQINALKISNRTTISSFQRIPFGTMNNLRSLILSNINYNDLKYLFQLSSFSNIFKKLNIFKLQSTRIDGLDSERIFVLKKVFSHMPSLRFCQIPYIDVNDFDDLMPALSLEEFIIDYSTMVCLGK